MSEILVPVDDTVRGKVIINMTTGTPGARFYYSGSQNAFETHRPTLKVLGDDATYYGTDAGLVSVYYMALVGLSYEIWRARFW